MATIDDAVTDTPGPNGQFIFREGGVDNKISRTALADALALTGEAISNTDLGITDFDLLDNFTGYITIRAFLDNGFDGTSNYDGSLQVIRRNQPTGDTVTQIYYENNQSYIRTGTGAAGSTAWNPWQLIYQQSNIVGIVSQSGGIPTGAVVQDGSNANGEFVRWADGTQICHSILPFTDTLTLQNVLYLSPVIVWTFPIPFISPPSVPHSGGSANVMTMGAGDTLVNQVSFYAVRTFSSAAVGLVSVSAIGRWY